MKNSLLYKIESKVIICVKGNNIERFIHRLVNNNIELLEIKQIKYNEVNITIYEHDYKKVLKLKTTYEISLIGEKGLIKIKHFLLKNIYLIISFLICLIILKILTNLIFQIDIIHNDKEIRNIISRELTSAGIKKYTLNKKYNEIQDIKQNILNKYKDKIEWLEIEKVGVKYVVRVQERSIIDRTKEDGKHNIVSKKSAIIKKINATSGTIVKSINDYVVEGDVIISGEIKLNDEIKNYVNASGTVYGEVWYSTTVEYPFTYKEIKETGKKKNVYSIKFINKYFNIFDFKKYKTSIKNEKLLISNNTLPIQFVKLEEKETKVIDDVLTEELAIDKAYELSVKKMKENLKEGEYIIKSNILKTTIKEDKVILEMFFSVYEDITGYRDITIVESE